MQANIWLLTVIRCTCRVIISGGNKPEEAMKNQVGSKRPDETNRRRIHIEVIGAIICEVDVQLQPDALTERLLLARS